MSERPILAITMGDPAGIGPEIVVKALVKREVYELCRPLVVGNTEVIKQATDIAKKDLRINKISDVKQAVFEHGTIDVMETGEIDVHTLEHGKVNAGCGKAAGDCIAKAIELAVKGEVDGTVTAPIHKESLNLGGYNYAGHTEFYADRTGTKKYSMLLAHGNFRVVHVTTHVPLREVSNKVKRERVLEVIQIAHNACVDLGIANPRVGVAGLNPHAGDGGMFGREEIDEISPAIEEARKSGMIVEGPIPADTIFSKAKGGMYDIVVAMYHDQGHIPMKFDGFKWDDKYKKWESVSGVNVTLGLPIIRASVDHGTAFGKAGKGTANPQSMIEAISIAVQMALSKKKKING